MCSINNRYLPGKTLSTEIGYERFSWKTRLIIKRNNREYYLFLIKNRRTFHGNTVLCLCGFVKPQIYVTDSPSDGLIHI